jgi:hypothetical protein
LQVGFGSYGSTLVWEEHEVQCVFTVGQTVGKVQLLRMPPAIPLETPQGGPEPAFLQSPKVAIPWDCI